MVTRTKIPIPLLCIPILVLLSPVYYFVGWDTAFILFIVFKLTLVTYLLSRYLQAVKIINASLPDNQQLSPVRFSTFSSLYLQERSAREELQHILAQILNDQPLSIPENSCLRKPELYTLLTNLEQEHRTLKQVIADQKWIQEGESTVSETLRNHMNAGHKEAYSSFLNSVITFIRANQGAIYQVEEDQFGERILVRKASYAITNTETQTLQWGQGIIGRMIAHKEVQIEANIPKGFIHVNSGLGEASPTLLTFIPIYHNENAIAIMELAFFRKLNELEITFLNKISGLSGVILENRNNHEKTQKLLDITKSNAAALKENETTLRQSEAELLRAKEELDARLIELKAESNLTSCIVSAINKSNASLELDMYGNILHANQMFLSVMGYELSYIQGRHESFLLEKEESASEKYKLMWNSLNQGNFISGEFIRLNSSGKKTWLEATYNPIIDLEGKPYKIIMYATFTTEMKEKENDYLNKIALLNETSAILELNPEGEIKNSNQKFLDILKLKRKDLRGKHFASLLEPKENQLNGAKVFQQNFPITNPIRGHIYLKGTDEALHKFSTVLMPTKDITDTIKGHMVLLSLLD